MSTVSSFSSSEDIDEELVCKPLNSLKEVRNFIKDPPSWRSLCVELTPHSDYAIRNMDIVRQNHPQEDYEITLERTENFCHFDPDNIDVVRHERRTLPKTLVCHDMANGYHDDSKVHGSPNSDAYTFYNWAVVDIFCYFSHHFITIPPLGWINVAHEHGVKVIGTVITEWTEGAQIWEYLLSEQQRWEGFASDLATIAKTLHFDGWLLNIENKIGRPETLLQFVRHLHRLLHRELRHAALVWYDSVTDAGHLHWQNALNSKNKEFFHACDGMFTNYSWSEVDVASSRAAAGARATDLFVGIDVWGRNFFGGGQFNTQQAVKIAHRHGLSLAIFAPAWTHEAMDDQDSQTSSSGLEHLSPLQRFLLRDRALWGSLWPYLNTKLPRSMPFQTSFCRGQGTRRRLYGEVVGPSAWYNLRHQRYQPSAAHGAHAVALAPAPPAAHAVALAPAPPAAHAVALAPAPPAAHAVALAPAPPAAPAHRPRPRPRQLLPVQSAPVPVDPDTSNATVSSISQRRSLKDRIKDLFRKRPRHETVASAAPQISSRSSMQRLSLSLKLGRKTDKKRIGLVHVPEESECLEMYLRDSFNGGSCLAIHPSDIMNVDHRFTRLFHCEFSVERSLVVCVVTKTLAHAPTQYLDVEVRARDGAGARSGLALAGRQLRAGPAGRSVAPLSPADAAFRDLQRYLLLHEPGFYVSVENSYGWKVRYYELPMAGCQVTSVNCRAGHSTGPILLGHFGLCQRSEHAD